MAKLRNILIHEYINIDHRKVYDSLQNNLDDFRRFSQYVYEWLVKEGCLEPDQKGIP